MLGIHHIIFQYYWRIVNGIIKINELDEARLYGVMNGCMREYNNCYGLIVNYYNCESWRIKPNTATADQPYEI